MFRIERQLDMRWCILSEIFKNKFTTIQFHVVYFIAAGLKAIYFVSFLIKMWSSFVIYKLADCVTNTIALLIYYRSTPTIGWRSLHFSSSLFHRLLINFIFSLLFEKVLQIAMRNEQINADNTALTALSDEDWSKICHSSHIIIIIIIIIKVDQILLLH